MYRYLLVKAGRYRYIKFRAVDWIRIHFHTWIRIQEEHFQKLKEIGTNRLQYLIIVIFKTFQSKMIGDRVHGFLLLSNLFYLFYLFQLQKTFVR